MRPARERWSIAGMQRFVASLRRDLVKRSWKPPWGVGTTPSRLTPTQELFCLWNAERLQISLDESRQRYNDSWRTIPGGHAGETFRWFCDLSYRIFRPLCDDRPGELFAMYDFYGPLHLLRMLSYDDPQWPDDHPIVTHLPSRKRIRVIDFGCGLAHESRSLAAKLSSLGRDVELVLADIPTVRKPFLLWVCSHTGLGASFLDCTEQVPVPALPSCDICIATNVLEHLPRPLENLTAFDGALQPGGLFWTDIADHNREFMHINPSLQAVRDRLEQLRYEPITPFRLYRKPSRTA